jgi:hypothetical protein
MKKAIWVRYPNRLFHAIFGRLSTMWPQMTNFEHTLTSTLILVYMERLIVSNVWVFLQTKVVNQRIHIGGFWPFLVRFRPYFDRKPYTWRSSSGRLIGPYTTHPSICITIRSFVKCVKHLWRYCCILRRSISVHKTRGGGKQAHSCKNHQKSAFYPECRPPVGPITCSLQ